MMNQEIDKAKLSSFIKDLLDGKERNIKGITYKMENGRLMNRVWRDFSGCGDSTMVWLPAFIDFQTILDYCNPNLGPVGFRTGVLSTLENLFAEL